MAEILLRLAQKLPAPESPFVNLLLLSALYASSVSEQLRPLLMVLEARDYGFIGLTLKDLIFHESEMKSTWRCIFTGLEETFAV